MIRLAELALLLAPAAIYLAALYVGYRISPPIAWSMVAALTLAAAATVWFGIERGLDPGEKYVPAHVVNGRIVQGRGIPEKVDP